VFAQRKPYPKEWEKEDLSLIEKIEDLMWQNDEDMRTELPLVIDQFVSKLIVGYRDISGIDREKMKLILFREWENIQRLGGFKDMSETKTETSEMGFNEKLAKDKVRLHINLTNTQTVDLVRSDDNTEIRVGLSADGGIFVDIKPEHTEIFFDHNGLRFERRRPYIVDRSESEPNCPYCGSKEFHSFDAGKIETTVFQCKRCRKTWDPAYACKECGALHALIKDYATPCAGTITYICKICGTKDER